MQKTYPTLITDRLVLNQPVLSDVEDIENVLKDEIYYRNTINIPKPYTKESAIYWVNLARELFESGNGLILAIRTSANGKIIGGIGLGIDSKFNKAELGYWLHQDFWNKGFATEAVKAVIKFGFEELKLKRIFSTHFDFNIASGKVMENAGMKKEGVMECFTKKDGQYQNHVLYAIINQNIT